MHETPVAPDEPRRCDAARSLVAEGRSHRDSQPASAAEPRAAGRRQALCLGLAGLAALAAPRPAPGSERPVQDKGLIGLHRIAVGPTRKLSTLAEAAQNARDGDLIEVDAGDYRRDVAVWAQHGISLRAVGGRVRLYADGAAAEGKAIWVVRAQGMHATGFDFSGCHVPHHNGAGIRLEAGSLSLHDCRFIDNQMGLMTSNDPTVSLQVYGCELGVGKHAPRKLSACFPPQSAPTSAQPKSGTTFSRPSIP